jgi:hypothetical protein
MSAVRAGAADAGIWLMDHGSNLDYHNTVSDGA